jgi:hypothetical protein
MQTENVESITAAMDTWWHRFIAHLFSLVVGVRVDMFRLGGQEGPKSLDSCLRGNDENLDAAL